MKRVLFQFLTLFFIISVPVNGQTPNKKLYVGTFTSGEAEGIYLCNFDSNTGNLTLEAKFKGIDNPNFLKISPDNNYLYAATRPPVEIEKSGGYINAYKIGLKGRLHFIDKQVSHGSDPCYIDVSKDGKFVATATYGGGSVSLYPVNKNGGIYPASSTFFFEGSGPNKDRQSEPHAHSIMFSPFSDEVFSADLGTDQLNIFQLKNNELIPAAPEFLKTEAGSGPRHFEFHPSGNFIYVINELNSTITVFKNDGVNREKFQTIKTIPKDFEGENYCADIHISADGKNLYGSNRGHNSIAVFKVEPTTKKLKLLTNVPAEGNWPRNFTLSEDGKFMLVANQNSNNITVFRINPETGIPVFTENELKLPSPVCLEFLNY
jgi:6-phosphogluconolactonase